MRPRGSSAAWWRCEPRQAYRPDLHRLDLIKQLGFELPNDFDAELKLNALVTALVTGNRYLYEDTDPLPPYDAVRPTGR
jgi:hypothetical protein